MFLGEGEYSGYGKGKGHEVPEGEQMYSSTLPSTSALDSGGWSTPRPDIIYIKVKVKVHPITGH